MSPTKIASTGSPRSTRKRSKYPIISIVFVLVSGSGSMNSFHLIVNLQRIIFPTEDPTFSESEPPFRLGRRQMTIINKTGTASSSLETKTMPHATLSDMAVASDGQKDEPNEIIIPTSSNLTTMILHHKNATTPHYYAPIMGDNLWNSSNLLPEWMKEYFAWHQNQRLLLNATSWEQDQFKFLIATALRGRKSGGMTDRIRPIPALLKLAAQTQRILMVYWERPFALEEFLFPPLGGMDWRVPDYMIPRLKKAKIHGNWDPLEEAARTNYTRNKIVASQYQSWNYGELWYKEHSNENEPPLYPIFRDIWKVVFTPSPPVAERIHDNFERMGLIPGEFATAHIRALYAIDDRPKTDIERIAKNAMNCVSNLRPGGPFFVASDSIHAIETAIQYGHERNVTVVASNHPQQPLHLDFQNESDASLTPAHFYDGFVDVYLMGATRCAAVGPGGFARWGHLLGYNETCAIHHFGRKSQTCTWEDASSSRKDPIPGYPSEEERLVLQAAAKLDIPRFPVPMEPASRTYDRSR